jgi:pimeloyl-ACP methyl ester carboxylesterase
VAARTGARRRPYFNLPEAELRRRLIAGTQHETVAGHVGKELYAELRRLAKAARKRPGPQAPRVYILHGIMGSMLGYPGPSRDVLWVNPNALAAGRLTELALPLGNRLRPLGVQTFMYLKLKLALECAGFDVRFHAYDWRQNILSLGKELMQRLRAEANGPVSVVAHSMGGLVARAAMVHDRQRQIARLIMLGTPNYGSFAAVLALRGAYPPVHKIALLDHEHDPDTHAQHVFATFEGLYQMLPDPERLDGLDLRRASSWPSSGPKLQTTLLTRSAAYRSQLAPADERCVLIAGADQPTVTAMRISANELLFEVTSNGDGTVPLSLACLPGGRTYYVAEGHTELPSNSDVIAAIRDLLARGVTKRLASRHRPSRATPRVVRERDLRSTETMAHDWDALDVTTQRGLLEGIVFPGPPARPSR